MCSCNMMEWCSLLFALMFFTSSFTAEEIWPDVDYVVVKTNQELCAVSENFLSVAIDTKFIFKRNLSKLEESAVFMNIARGLHPAYLRIGGTAADLLVFDENLFEETHDYDFHLLSQMDSLGWISESKNCLRKWPKLLLSKSNWLGINNFASKARLNLLFDLNVLLRQSSNSIWDPSNAHKLIKFSQSNNLSLDWQLGNEPNSFYHVFGKKVPPQQLAEDIQTLSHILIKYPLYKKSKIVGPDITSPRGPKRRQAATLQYFDQFLSKATHTISAATWHQYYVNGHNATKEDFMDPHIFEVLRREINDIKSVVTKNSGQHFPVWITETASAFGGGSPGLSNSYVSGFMWLDKLGMAATYNISVVVRQSLIGGNYGLVDEKTLEPNTNYWISYIFKKIVGPSVLELRTSRHNSKIRLYAHCHKEPEAGRSFVVIFGMNLSSSDYKGRIVIDTFNSSKIFRVEEYILTAFNGLITSRAVLLNGKVMKITRSGELPILKPIQSKTRYIKLPSESLGFYVIKDLPRSVCGKL